MEICVCHTPSSSSDEIPGCRICLERETDAVQNPLIAPCKCSGSSRYVHRACLQKWRCLCFSAGNPKAIVCCEICGYSYQFRARPGFSKCTSVTPHSAKGLLLGLMCFTGLALGFVPLLQSAQPQLQDLQPGLARIGLHIANSIIMSGLCCATLLHFGYPTPVLRSLFGAVLMIYMLVVLGPLQWWRAHAVGLSNTDEMYLSQRGSMAWVVCLVVWALVGLRVVMPAAYRDLHRVFLLALEGPFELEEYAPAQMHRSDSLTAALPSHALPLRMPEMVDPTTAGQQACTRRGQPGSTSLLPL